MRREDETGNMVIYIDSGVDSRHYSIYDTVDHEVLDHNPNLR